MKTALALLFLAVSTQAATITVTRDGAVAADAQLCRFRAGSRDNPLKRWFASQEVVCSAQDAFVLPDGDWNVFARTEREVSRVALAGSDPLDLALLPAKAMAAAAGGGVYYAPRIVSAYPVAERTLVPEGQEVWRIGVERGVPAFVDGAGAAVLAWVHVPENDRAAMKTAKGLESPHVEGATALPAPELVNGALVLVRDAKAGELALDLSGRGWLPYKRRVRVGASRLTVVDDPLLARGSATIVVNWSADPRTPELERSIGACSSASRPVPQYDVALLSCAGEECEALRHQTFAGNLTFGSFAMEGLPPGNYTAELRFGILPAVSGGRMPVRPFEIVDLRVSAFYSPFYGSVTRGGEPLLRDATLRFPDGTGFSPRDGSDYQAVLRRPLLDVDDVIDIVACDDPPLRAFVLADRLVRRSQRLDLDIPVNELTVVVADTFTQAAIRNAKLKLVVMSKSHPKRAIVTRTITPKEDGRFVVAALPERELQLTVTAPGYQSHPVEPFSLTKTEKRTIDVAMTPLRGTSAKVVSRREFDRATISWYGADGFETERTELASDGTFNVARSHAAGETVAIVSTSHPLWATRWPATSRGGEATLLFPDDAPRRRFDVYLTTPTRAPRFVTLIVGGLRIPMPVFAQHQSLRKLAPQLRANNAMIVADVAESGQLEVLVGPPTDEVPGRFAGIDLFALPQYAGATRKALPPGAQSLGVE